jgi:hypothetical protein
MSNRTVVNRDGSHLVVRLYEAISQFPEGLTGADCYELFPTEGNRNAVFSALSAMAKCGVLRINGKRPSAKTGKRVSVYVTGKPVSEFSWLLKNRRTVKPTEAGLQMRLDAAHATIKELDAWKADAIARFPDLAVEPALIAARKKVAALFHSEGDKVKANAVLTGLHDATPIVRLAAALIDEMAP